jgi:hypothetical protein
MIWVPSAFFLRKHAVRMLVYVRKGKRPLWKPRCRWEESDEKGEKCSI